MPRLSIIIPAYNAEAYIQQCVESVLNQTEKDREIIVIDDGSTDGTGQILDRIAENNSCLNVIHQENKGLYTTRKIGLQMTHGEYIGWVDADDYIEKTMYKDMLEIAYMVDSELVYCDYRWFPSKPQNKEKWFREYTGTKDVNYVERNSQPWNKIVKRELLEKIDIANSFETCFDEIYIKVLLEAKNPISISKELYNYRVVQNSMSTNYNNINHYKKFVDASKELKKIMHPLTQESFYWKEYFDYRIVYYLITTMIVSANSGNRVEYNKAQGQLRRDYPYYKRNIHFWNILNRNFGTVKARVIGQLIPLSYSVARAVCKVGMR